MPGQLPELGLPGVGRVRAPRWCARRRWRSRGGPDTELGHALEEGRELTGPLITELANAGDPVARGAIETIGRALGVGITNLVNIFNPQVVVIGGGVIAAGELLLAPAREVMLERALSPGEGRRARRGRALRARRRG